MKVIDLLNKIANGEFTPEFIKYEGTQFKKTRANNYCNEDGECLMDWVNGDELNDEIECLDKLHLYYYVDNRVEEETGEITFNNLCDIIGNQRIHEDKINELEKRIEELEKK